MSTDRKTQCGNAAEVPDLSELSASKKTALTPDQLAPANEADLTSASISASDVMRVSQRTDMRRTAKEISVSPDKSAVTLSNSRSRADTSKSHENGRMGLFKNPFYRYDGGIMNKLMAFIGNILKMIERFILKLLGMRDAAPVPGQQKNTSQAKPETKEAAQDAAVKEKQEKEKRKERLEMAGPGARN
jgi:hypothetical protein